MEGTGHEAMAVEDRHDGGIDLELTGRFARESVEEVGGDGGFVPFVGG